MLGLMSLGCFILGPFVWSWSDRELCRIAAGEIDPATRQLTRIGRYCAIGGTVLLLAGIVGLMMFFALSPGRT